MIRLIVVAFALTVATSAQAMSPAPLHQPDGMITQVREACGAGRVRINGVCVARTTKRRGPPVCAMERRRLRSVFLRRHRTGREGRERRSNASVSRNSRELRLVDHMDAHLRRERGRARAADHKAGRGPRRCAPGSFGNILAGKRAAERERIGGIARIGSFTAFGLSHAPYAPYAPYASRPHWANA